MKTVRIFAKASMKKDADKRYVGNGYYLHAENIKIIDGQGTGGTVDQINGTELVANLPVTAGATYIGGAFYNQYFYLMFVSSTNTQICRIKEGASSGTLLFNQDIGMTTATTILDISFQKYIDPVTATENILMYFTDGKLQPFKVNITRLIASSSHYATTPDLYSIRKPPVDAPTMVPKSDGNSSNLKNTAFQFAYRWIYEDNEYSTLSFLTPTLFRPAPNTASQMGYTDGYAGYYGYITTGVFKQSLDGLSAFNNITGFPLSEPIKMRGDASGFTIAATDHEPSTTYWKLKVTNDGWRSSREVSIPSGWDGTDYHMHTADFDVSPDGSAIAAVSEMVYTGSGSDTANIHDRVIFSLDGGVTWTDYDQFQVNGKVPLKVAITKNNPNQVYVLTEEVDATNTNITFEIHISSNFGQDFTRAGSLVLDYGTIVPYTTPDLAISDDGTILGFAISYVGTSGVESVMVISNDSGNTLTKKSTNVSGYIYAIGAIGDGSGILAAYTDQLSSGTAPRTVHITINKYVKTSTDITETAVYGTSFMDNYIYSFYYYGQLTPSRDGSEWITSIAHYTGLIAASIPATATDGIVSYRNVNGSTVDIIGDGSAPLSSAAWLNRVPAASSTIGEAIANMYTSADITVDTGGDYVRTVEVFARDTRTDVYYKIKTIDKDVSTPSSVTFSFSNDGSYPAIDEKRAKQLFSNNPLNAKSQKIINNHLIYGDYTEGMPDAVGSVTMTASVVSGAPTGSTITSTTSGNNIQYAPGTVSIPASYGVSVVFARYSSEGDFFQNPFYGEIPTAISSVSDLYNFLLTIVDSELYTVTFNGTDTITVAAVDGTMAFPSSIQYYSKDFGYKSGAPKTFKLAFYDDYNRTSGCFAESKVVVPELSSTSQIFSVQFSITGTVPSWATKAKIVRPLSNLNYEIIHGFGNAIVYDGKIALKLPSKAKRPEAGDYLQLVLSSGQIVSSQPISDISNVVEITDNLFSDNNGTYIVIDEYSVSGYTLSDVTAQTSLFPQAVAYLYYGKDNVDESAFYEVPSQSISVTPGAAISVVISSTNDGDVFWDAASGELNKIGLQYRLHNEGRLSPESDIMRQVYRPQSLTNSELFNNDFRENGLSNFMFASENWVDVDGAYGEIKAIDSFGGDLIVMQEDGVCNVLIEKTIIHSPAGGKTIATSNKFLGSFEYALEENGIQSHFAYTHRGFRFYLYDNKRGQHIRLSRDGETIISDVFDMSQFLLDYSGANPSSDIRMFYDPALRESIIQDLTSYFSTTYNNCDALGFSDLSENLRGYSSFYTMEHAHMIAGSKSLFMVSGTDFYLYNSPNKIANKNLILGNQRKSVLQFPINDDPTDSKILFAVGIEGESTWDTFDIETDNGKEAHLLAADFEQREDMFYADSPMLSEDLAGTDPLIASYPIPEFSYLVIGPVSSFSNPTLTFSKYSNIDKVIKGSSVYVINGSNYRFVGYVGSVGTDNIVLDRATDPVSTYTPVSGDVCVIMRPTADSGAVPRFWTFVITMQTTQSTQQRLFAVLATIQKSPV